MKFFDELKRRNVIKATIAYITVAWVLLQLISTVLPNFGAPEWVLKTSTFLLIVGLPVWIIFSWVYELTPEGIKKTEKIDRGDSITAQTNKRLTIIIIITLLALVAITYFKKPSDIGVAEVEQISSAENEKSIAVLPFVNMSGDAEQEYFADGLSEELINMLTRLPNLKVIGRTSSFAYKDKNEDLREIGKALDVAYLLEGSVRKSGNKVRITAQLIQASDGTHLWSETFDRNMDDIFEIQDQISASVADALRITLAINPMTSKRQANDPEAYNYFLRGKFHYETTYTEKDTDLALKWFNEAIRVDSSFSLAWTYASMCYWRNSRNSDDELFKKAKNAALRAHELDPGSGIAAVNVAEILDNEFDFRGALEKIELALELEPEDPYVLRNAGRFYTILGRSEQSIDFCQRALKFDPIQRTAMQYLIKAFYYSGRYEEAIPYARKYAEVVEDTPFHECIEILMMDGGTEILAELKKRNHSDNPYYKIIENIASGDNKGATDLLDKIKDDNNASLYMIARTYAWSGENEKALDWLERAYQMKDKRLVYAKVDPKFHDLRNNLRFKNMIEQLDYPK